MSYQPEVLVIDDEPQILRALRTILSAHQFRVTTASRGEEGLALASVQPPDIILLDLALPDLDGVEVCRQLRQWTELPVIVISVRESEREKVEALDSGADDYVTKPFGIEELLARMRVALRRKMAVQGKRNSSILLGPVLVDLDNRRVTRNGIEVDLTPTEYKLLSYLVVNAGRVLTYPTILINVWGPQEAEHIEYLRVFIGQLRKKLEDDPENPKYLVNEPRIGYRLMVAETVHE
jgi:two-component system KDP operon response regulator KdpE